jgi:hypothetical protein
VFIQIFIGAERNEETHMSKFVPKGSSSDAGVAKFVAGAGAPVLEKVGAGEKEMGIAGRVEHVTGDGVIHDLARLLNSFYTSLPKKDPRLLTTAEREKLYEQIVAALGAEGALTDYGKDLARRLAGLDTLDGQVDSRQWEAEGAANSQARQKENGGYATRTEPADRPRSVAKDDMAAIRQQILTLRDRVSDLVKRYEQGGR